MWFWQGAGRTAEGTYQAQVLDDHVPFLNRGVDVLHVIPTPFPDMWHRMGDDGEHLDMDTVGDWGVLVTGWLVWALGLEADMGEGKGKRKVALGIKTKSEL